MMVNARTAAVLIMAATPAVAQEPTLTDILDEVTVLTCAVGSDVGLLAYRELPTGELHGLGAFMDSQFVREGERITILQGADVLSIDGTTTTSIRGGVVSQGRCTNADDAFNGLIAALLSTGLDGAQQDLLAEVEDLGADLNAALARTELMRRDLVAAEARAADAARAATAAGQERIEDLTARLAAAEARASEAEAARSLAMEQRDAARGEMATVRSSAGVLYRTIERREEQIAELEAELEAAQDAVEASEAAVPCVETVRNNFRRAVSDGDWSPVQAGAIRSIAQECNAVVEVR